MNLNAIRLLRPAAVSFIAALFLACSAETAEDGTEEGAEEELRTTGITAISVNRSTGFRPPASPGRCHPAGRWNVDFKTGMLTGNACVDGTPVSLNRTLSEAELGQVKSAVSKVRTTVRPASCPTDMPVNSLVARTGASETNYVEARAACGAGTAVTAATLSPLVDLMGRLSVVAANAR